MGLSKKLFKNEVLHLAPLSYLKHRSGGVRISSSPVFVVGCGHSGTTMLRHLLGLHCNLYAVPYESRVFFHSGLKIQIASALWSFTAVSRGKTRWVEKTPSHIHRIGRILALFPDSRILLMIRDGRNVAVSLHKRWGDFDRSVRRWTDDNQAGEKYWKHPQVMKLYFENLVEDFEVQARDICDFIGEPFDDRLLEFSRQNLESETNYEVIVPDGAKPGAFRNRQIEKGLYRPRDKWLTDMTRDEKAIFKKLAGDMLVQYGYAVDDWW